MAYRAPEAPLDQTKLQTTAAPVDTFVRPSADTQAQQFAAALSEVEPKFARFGEQWLQQKHADDHQRGIQAAQDAYAHGTKMAELTREGSLPMQENDFFKAGLQEEMGRVSAGNFASDFTAKLAQDPAYQGLRDSTNLADFDQAVEKARADYLKQNGQGADEFFQKGFGGLSTQYMQQQRLEFANGIEKKLGDLADSTLHARTVQVITDEMGKVPPEELGKDLSTLASLSVNRGRPEKAVYSTMADAIDAAARQDPDPEHGRKILELFKHVEGLGGGKLSDSKYGAEKMDAASKDLLAQQYTAETRAFEEHQRAKAAAMDGLKTQLAKDILNGGRGTQIIQAAPPEFQADLIQHAAALKAQNDQRASSTNPWAFNRMSSRILTGGMSIDDIAKAPGIDGGDKIRLYDLYKSVNSEAGKGAVEGLKKEPYFAQAMELMKGFYVNPFGIVPADKELRLNNMQAALMGQALTEKLDGTLDKMTGPEKVAHFHDLAQQLGIQDQPELVKSLIDPQAVGGVGAAPPPHASAAAPMAPAIPTGAPAAAKPAPPAAPAAKPAYQTVNAQFSLTADEWAKAFKGDPTALLKARGIALSAGVPPNDPLALRQFIAAQALKLTKGN